MTRVLVCGGRDFEDRRWAHEVLNDIHARKCITQVIEGGARGADAIAHEWAIANNIDVLRFRALWDEHGKSAGFIRNQKMLDEGKPDMVLAFPGGSGTAHMVRIARQAGVLVIEEFSHGSDKQIMSWLTCAETVKKKKALK